MKRSEMHHWIEQVVLFWLPLRSVLYNVWETFPKFSDDMQAFFTNNGFGLMDILASCLVFDMKYCFFTWF